MAEAQGDEPVWRHDPSLTETSPHAHQILRGGVIFILGIVYIWMGFTWIVTPTETRIRGIEWAGLAAHLIGIWWILGGIIAITCTVLVRNARSFGFAVFASIITPLAVSGLFTWSIFHGNLRGYITAGSYAPYGILAAFVSWGSSRSQLASMREQYHDTDTLTAADGEGTA